jgi:hypothetical protein
MDPDPSIFIIDLQDAYKNKFKKKFFLHIIFKVPVLLHHFSKVKSKKKVSTIGIKVFLTIFA